jgi:hypothetical protein
LGPGLCERIHERIQKDASPGVNPIKEILSAAIEALYLCSICLQLWIKV